MGVGDVPSVPSLALGSGEVTLQSMTAAYAAFANHGLVPQPMLIRRVEDLDGNVLYESHDSSTRAISDTTAFLMSTMLADVINAGTGSRARSLGFTLPAAGKTGTTNDFNDAWFVGFTPKLVAGVWVGFDQPHTILPNGFAADVAVPIWAKFMKVATHGDKPEWFAPPAGITTASVCRLSGKLANRRLPGRRGRQHHRTARAPVDGLHRVLRPRHRADGDLRSASDARPDRRSSPASSAAGEKPAAPPPHADDGVRPAATGGERRGRPAADDPPAAPPKKKRGFWSRCSAAARIDAAENAGQHAAHEEEEAAVSA